MSKRKTRQQKIKSAERKQLKLELERLKLEIYELEKRIETQKKTITKEKHLKNLKICGSIGNFLAPFVIVAGVTIGATKFCGGGCPIVIDDIVKCKKYSLEYEADKLINANEQYIKSGIINSENSHKKLIVHTPLELTEDGMYQQYIRKYNINDSDVIELYDALLEGNFDYIENNLFDYDEETITYSEKINDLNYDNYVIEASLSIVDKDDTLALKESENKNKIVTVAELIVILGVGTIIVKIRKFKISYALNEINEIYKYNLNKLQLLEEKLDKKKQKKLTLSKER